ncbi:MAG: hypothetical protein IJN87_07650, partial [Firmicutes bacterium]|nr:hypothetical protein [Bacillota bacterium]
MNCPDENMKHIPKEKFAFVQKDQRLHDRELETKPIGFFKDAMLRFSRNKGAVVCAVIILVLAIYAVIGPMVSQVGPGVKDGYYSYALPKLSNEFDMGFWNGCSDEKMNQQTYDYYSNIPGAIAELESKTEEMVANRNQTFYNVSLDSYKKVGFVNMLLMPEEFQAVLDYQEETGIQLMYPLVDEDQIVCQAYRQDPNAWFKTDQKGVAQRSMTGDVINIYLTDENSEDGYAYYVTRQNGSQYEIRTLYYDWYVYENGFEPCFAFGADEYGYDIFARLGSGARLSLTLSIVAALVNLILGIIIGAL